MQIVTGTQQKNVGSETDYLKAIVTIEAEVHDVLFSEFDYDEDSYTTL